MTGVKARWRYSPAPHLWLAFRLRFRGLRAWGYTEKGKIFVRLTFNPYFDRQTQVMGEVLKAASTVAASAAKWICCRHSLAIAIAGKHVRSTPEVGASKSCNETGKPDPGRTSICTAKR